jgi:uncharacterized coiled-coil protein SlyX
VQGLLYAGRSLKVEIRSDRADEVVEELNEFVAELEQSGVGASRNHFEREQ